MTTTQPSAIDDPTKVTQDLVELGQQTYLPVYAPREMILDHGEGSRVWDIDGNEYIDLGTGISVNNLGHCNPDMIRVAVAQMKKLWHTSNIYFTEPPIRLAADLTKVSFADRVFFSNSGAEANEAAIKLARKFSSVKHPPQKREIITFKGSFHGRTLTTVTATAQPKYHEGFEPLPGGFTYCDFNDEEAITQLISEKTCAVMLEPIQGEGGITPAQPGFLKLLRKLCDQYEALLIFDEIQCGMGRTGKLFAHEWEGVLPDIMTLAKALGGGLPIGAMLTTEKVAQTLKVGDHGSTFGGNPVATALAAEALRQLRTPTLMKNVQQQGEYLKSRLNALNAELGKFKEIRGLGLMIGVELQGEWIGQAKNITEVCRRHGVLILQAGPNVLRFLPPLTITKEELDLGMDRFEATVKRFQPSSS